MNSSAPSESLAANHFRSQCYGDVSPTTTKTAHKALWMDAPTHRPSNCNLLAIRTLLHFGARAIDQDFLMVLASLNEEIPVVKSARKKWALFSYFANQNA